VPAQLLVSSRPSFLGNEPVRPHTDQDFFTSIPPWVVTMEALAPDCLPFERLLFASWPLANLDDACDRACGSLDILLEVQLQTAHCRELQLISDPFTATNFRYLHLTIGQSLPHHTVVGFDLLGMDTTSLPSACEAGALVELCRACTQGVPLSCSGEMRPWSASPMR
jgi:fumarylacetoacetase